MLVSEEVYCCVTSEELVDNLADDVYFLVDALNHNLNLEQELIEKFKHYEQTKDEITDEELKLYKLFCKIFLNRPEKSSSGKPSPLTPLSNRALCERIDIQELYQAALEAKNIKSVERLKNVTGYEIYADSLDKIMKGEPTLVFNYLKGNDVGTLYSLLTHKALREIAFRDPNFMFGVTNHRDNDEFRWLLHRYPGLWELIKEAIKSPDPILSQFSKPVLNPFYA